jgi:hypothetical protein
MNDIAAIAPAIMRADLSMASRLPARGAAFR